MTGRSYVAENNAARARLSALAARLSDTDLAQPIGHGWTVSAALAHLAFWDRRNLATLEEWERGGVQVTRVDPDPINDAMLPQWLAMPPRQAQRRIGRSRGGGSQGGEPAPRDGYRHPGETAQNHHPRHAPERAPRRDRARTGSGKGWSLTGTCSAWYNDRGLFVPRPHTADIPKYRCGGMCRSYVCFALGTRPGVCYNPCDISARIRGMEL